MFPLFQLFSLLGFICIQISRYSSASKGSYFSVIAMVAFWFTGILLLLYLFNFVYKFQKIPWTKMEFLFCALWSLMYLIAAALATSVYDNPHAAAAVSYLITSRSVNVPVGPLGTSLVLRDSVNVSKGTTILTITKSSSPI